MITWSETQTRLRADRQRLVEHLAAEQGEPQRFLALHPSYQAVFFHRLSFYFFDHGHRLVGRFFWHINLLLTGCDIPPRCDLGGGLLLPVPLAVTLVGRFGRNCTVHAHVGVGGGSRRRDDIGAGPGLPVIGDGVEIGLNSLVVGPVRIGDGAHIGPGCLVTRDVPAGAEVMPVPRPTSGGSDGP